MWLKLRNKLKDDCGNRWIEVDHLPASANLREGDIKDVLGIRVVWILSRLELQTRGVKGAEVHQVIFAIEKWQDIDGDDNDKKQTKNNRGDDSPESLSQWCIDGHHEIKLLRKLLLPFK